MPLYLCQARVRCVPHTKSLQDSNNTQRDSRRSIIALPVSRTRCCQQGRQDTRDALVVHVVDTRDRPLVVENAFHNVNHDTPNNDLCPADLLMITKNPLPSYQPILLAPRSISGSVFIVGCLNWSRPFNYNTSLAHYHASRFYELLPYVQSPEWRRQLKRPVAGDATAKLSTS